MYLQFFVRSVDCSCMALLFEPPCQNMSALCGLPVFQHSGFWHTRVISRGNAVSIVEKLPERMGTSFQLLERIVDDISNHFASWKLQDFAYAISKFFRGWYPLTPQREGATPFLTQHGLRPCAAWTQTPISAWLASVPTVPVLRNDHWRWTLLPVINTRNENGLFSQRVGTNDAAHFVGLASGIKYAKFGGCIRTTLRRQLNENALNVAVNLKRTIIRNAKATFAGCLDWPTGRAAVAAVKWMLRGSWGCRTPAFVACSTLDIVGRLGERSVATCWHKWCRGCRWRVHLVFAVET